MRVVVYSSVAPDVLRHLLWRLAVDLPEARVAGVLYETGRPPLARGKGISQFVASVGRKVAASVRARVERGFDAALRFIHAAPVDPNGPPLTLEALVEEWQGRGVAFHVTRDLHAAASLAFVRRLDVDLGVIYGTRVLEPSLSRLPRRGSIDICKHELPDYPGAVGPRTARMVGQGAEQIITVHRVIEGADAGAVLGERRFPIEPLDTLESVRMKAAVIGVDLIVDVLRADALGPVVERPAQSGGRLDRGRAPARQHATERRLPESRPRWAPNYMRPLLKRLARVPLVPLQTLRNHRRRRSRSFPIIVLFQHLTSDRIKRLGLPTGQFARHVRYLKRHYRIVSLDRAVELLREGHVGMPTVVLTLDDGYAENFNGLRAIAELEQVPFTVCVCTQHVTDRSELAHDIARGERGFPSMGWDEVRYFDRHGVTIASHTRTHFDCGQGGYARLVEEIAGSKRELEAELGHAIDAFAFPKGMPANIPPPANGIALQHYPVVMSAACGPNVAPMQPPMEIRRYGHPDSLLELELQVQELLDPPVPPRPVPHGLAFPSAAVPSARG